MKKTMFDPEAAALLADLLFDAIKDEDVEYIGGLETGAIPINKASPPAPKPRLAGRDSANSARKALILLLF